MRRPDRRILTAAALVAGMALSACDTADIADKIGEMGDKLTDAIPGNAKKPLPGERKSVFPQGVPGVVQGVPPEMMKGAQANQDALDAQVQPPPAETPKGKQANATEPKPKPKKKTTQVRKPPAQAASTGQTVAPVSSSERPAATPWPAPASQSTPQDPGVWPAPPGQTAPPAQAAWPAPPPTAQPTTR